MIILVDFENTHASGLEGYTYLNESDTLVMYYSDENSAVTKGVVQDLRSNGVHVRLVKLLKQHSNALDMYIASTTGMFLDSGEKICIVSKDRGYAAVRDFWHSLRGAEILLGETIKECLLNSELNDEARIRLCKEREQKATLVDAFTTMNTIPTRPTLSRNNQRRRRNDTRNFMEVSDPVAILPNPLVTETPADQLAKELQGSTKSGSEEAPVKNEKGVPKKPEEASEKQTVIEASVPPVAETAKEMESAPSSEKGPGTQEEHAKRTDRNRRNGRKRDFSGDAHKPLPVKESTTEEVTGERFGGYDGISKVNEASRIAMARRQERDELKAESTESTDQSQEKKTVEKKPEETKPEQKTTALLRPEAKTTAVVKADPNRVQFVWDPISHSMKKIGAPEEEKTEKKAPLAKTEDAASELSTLTAEPVQEEKPKTSTMDTQTIPPEKKEEVEKKPSSEKKEEAAKKTSSEKKGKTEKKTSSEKKETDEAKSSSEKKETAVRKPSTRKKEATEKKPSSEKAENAEKKGTASKKKQPVKKAEQTAENPQGSSEAKKQSTQKKSEGQKTKRRTSARSAKVAGVAEVEPNRTAGAAEEKLKPAVEAAISDTATESLS